MTSRRFATALFGAAALLAHSAPADAHRLDEYLQATLVGVDADRVFVEIALTAGAAVARGIIQSIDANGDGVVTAGEADAYTRQILADVSLTVDGRRLALALDDRTLPDVEAMAAGTGTIRLRASAAVTYQSGSHALVYRNDHRSDASVYLVNALTPADRRLHLGTPRRDPLQRTLTIDYDIDPGTRLAQIGWIAAAAAMLALVASRLFLRLET